MTKIVSLEARRRVVMVCGLVLVAMVVLLVHTRAVFADGDEPQACSKAVLDSKKTAMVDGLSKEELAQICLNRNVEGILGACIDQEISDSSGTLPLTKQSLSDLQTQTCKVFVDGENATTVTARERLARAYRAANSPLSPKETGYRFDRGADESLVAASIVAGGVADFLVKRAEAEVTTFAGDLALDRICGHDRRKKWFVNTCKVANTSGGNPGLVALKRAMRDDIEKLPTGLATMAASEVSKKPELMNTLGAIVCATDFGIAVTRAMRSKADITELLEKTGRLANFRLSPALVPCDPAWARFDKFVSSVSELAKMETLLPTDLTSKIDSTIANDIHSETLEAIARLLRAIKTYKHAPQSHREKAAIEVAVATTTVAIRLGCDLSVKKCSSEETVQSVIKIVEFWQAVSEEEYGDAVGLLAESGLLDQIKNKRTRQAFSLASDVAVAESGTAVSASLERFAEPIGGWKRRHEHHVTLGVQGMAGAFYSPKENATRSGFADGESLAPTLSIGLGLNFSSNVMIPGGFRFGLYAPLVDVGTVASVRFNSEDDNMNAAAVETTPDVSFLQLLAPGVHGYVSLGKSPFLVGGGFNYIPELRKEEGGNEKSSVVRYGLFLAVDLALMNVASWGAR